MARANKETSVKAAKEKAEKAPKENLVKLIVEEAMKITRGEQHSVQQMMAYCRRMQK